MRGPIAYADGSCLGNPGPGGWGIRLLYPDGRVEEFGAAERQTTNNRMELQAAIAVLEHLGHWPNLTVYTDSRYVLDGLTKWLPGWRRRDWITSTGTPVKNRLLWQKLAALAHPQINWRHVRGHTGNPNNERVDDIARAFAKGQTPQLYYGQVGAPADPVQEAALDAAHVQPVRQNAPKWSKPQYVSIVQGAVSVDPDWPTCEARVRGVSGARYKKVRTSEELAEFCAKHGVDIP